jgi:tRNA nucleotidyltransferase/poly(A) polymerase
MMPFYLKIKDKIQNILNISSKYGIEKPYFVGGTVRDFLIKKEIDAINDFDITNLSDDCSRLGVLFSLQNNYSYKIHKDTHVSVKTNVSDFDFSANVINKNVIKWLSENNKDKKSAETYSRDFTINSMHQDMLSEDIFDLTKFGLSDAQNKIIRTTCPPEITLGNDKRRIYRAISLSVRLNFSIDGKIIDWVRDVYANDTSEDDFSRTSEVNKAILINGDMTYNIIKDMGLQKKIPLVGQYKDYIISNNLVLQNI